MTEPIRCPDCGRENPADAERCQHCNHPLHEGAPVDEPPPAPAAAVPVAAAPAAAVPAAAVPVAAAPVAASAEAPASAPVAATGEVPVRRIRPIRPRRPRSGDSQMVLQLWLVFGTIGVAAVLWVAIQSNVQRATAPVEGANTEQLERANQLMQAVERDSNDVASQRALADLLYDTANWPRAIVHYKAVLRRDSTQATAIVDLGVCYYNLGRPDEAEQYFLQALRHDPHQPVAYFNLGIVNETREQFGEALQYYHRAMQADPPESMKELLNQRMAALMEKLGKEAPPLPAGK